MDIFLLYLFTRIDNVISLFAWGLFLIPMAYIIYTIGVSIYNDSYRRYKPDIEYFQHRKKCFFVWVICLFSVVLIPHQKDILLIVGGKVALDVANSPEAKETGGKLYQLLQKKIDEELNKPVPPKVEGKAK